MHDADIDRMAKVADDHWWYQAKLDLAVDEIERGATTRDSALDVGCGTGQMLERFGRLGFGTVIGVDPSERALVHARQTAPYARLLRGGAERVPLRSGSIDALCSMDVVEHCVDDVGAVREYARIVKPGGLIVLAVPAYQWMWSEHDKALGHQRRYNRGSLRSLVRDARLDLLRTSYFHSLLVPPAALLRRTPLQRLASRKSSAEMSYVNPRINRVLRRMARAERAVIRRGPLPVGLSLLAVCRRTAVNPHR